MKSITIAAAALALSLAPGTHAAEACRAGQDVMACKAPELQRLQRALQRELAVVRARINDAPADAGIDRAEVLKDFNAGQRDWARFVERDCQAKHGFVGSGTARNDVQLSCLIDHHTHRLHQLRRWD